MPTVSVVRDRLMEGIARGYAHLDWSALGLLAAEDAGLATGTARSARRRGCIEIHMNTERHHGR
jgi:hypothetical protein